jgi:hypothetical protein
MVRFERWGFFSCMDLLSDIESIYLLDSNEYLVDW